MMNARQISYISFLAKEILGDIFSRLPVKTLLQLKFVCKRWCTLISTPWFICAQLKRSSSDPDNHYILVQTARARNGLIRTRNPGCLIKLTEPCKSAYSVVGSINGLVCLTTTCFRICLWNPSINQFKILPMHSINLQKARKCYVSVGFGYEQNSDDYKVMMILNSQKGRSETIVEVYSTKLESWRDVKTNHRLNMTTCCCDAIIEGFNYWVIRNMNKPRNIVLASFDLRREIFSLIPVSEVLVTESQSFRAMNYHGSLALLAYSSHTEFKTCLEVWMIEGGRCGEEGVWQKKFTFGMGFEFSTHWGLTSGDIVVENAPNVPFLFNLRTKQLRIIGTNSIRSVFYYTESLVSIKGFKPVPNQSKKKRKASIP
ncbi:F-box/kelch-repeat protein At3g23880-like [Solanum dulcamara]|uniref:F-box/kelch-repeat protein At3g23880-like n=1 Tax=Solanum dulcamara TaxID=45834 RepID=UPI002485C7E2|nr:F-box/kelch-repeat protein At3g23880-like [Solanum dulcamara]